MTFRPAGVNARAAGSRVLGPHDNRLSGSLVTACETALIGHTDLLSVGYYNEDNSNSDW